MMKAAFLFAGQGSQVPGMGEELYEVSPAARKVFNLVDSIRPSTSTQCFKGTAEELKQTVNAQPCLFATDLAAYAALVEAGVSPQAVAGFSLGEMVALVAAGVLDTESAFELTVRRANAMEECAKRTEGTMLAVLGAKEGLVEEICEKHGVFPANYNCPGQLVISGKTEDIQAARTALRELKVKSIPLAVSGAFHTPYMQEASHMMALYVRQLSFRKPKGDIYSNCTGKPYERDLDGIKKNIVMQVKSPVLWQESLERMAASGISTFVELGPGKALSGFVGKTCPDATTLNVCDAASLGKTVAALRAAGE